MAEPTSAGWPSAPELTPAPGTPSEAAPPQDNWVYWAMLPPPPPPLSSPVAGTEPCQKEQPHVQPQPTSGAFPPFDAQILPAAQPPFDAQAPADGQSQFSGQQAWNFQASTPWYWGLSPNGFPTYHTSYHSPEDRRSVLNTHTGRLSTACNSNFIVIDNCLLASQGTCTP